MKFLRVLIRLVGVAALMLASLMFLVEEKTVGAVFAVIGVLLTFVFPKKINKKQIANPEADQPKGLDRSVDTKKQTTEIFGEDRLAPTRWVVFDTETTGLRPEEDRIIEFSGRLVEEGRVLDTFTTLINPKCELPPHITRITGIAQADLKNARIFRAVARKILAFIGGVPVVAHNA